jgi:serine protease Do
VDLWVVRRPPTAREAYAAARALEALAAPGGFLEIKRVLEGGEGPVLRGLSADGVARAQEALAAHGAEGRLLPHQAAEAPSASPAQPRGWPLGWLIVAGVALLALAILVWPRPPAPSQPVANEASPPAPRASTPTRPLSPRELGALAGASAASLRCAESLGSGFFIAPDRLVTNAHVLCEDGSPLEVSLSDGRKLQGMTERSDRWLDIALVTVEGAEAPVLRLGDAAPLRQGDQLFFYGSPRGLDFTLSQAMVSHANRSLQGIAYLQLDGNVNPGNSGGPLLTSGGEVVGIITAMVGEASGLGLALPVNYLYEGERPFFDSPPGADRAAWKRIKGEVAAEEEREVEEAREIMRKPGLVAAVLTADFRVVAVVARQSDLEPFGERLDLRLQRRNESLCTPYGQATRWRRMGSTTEGPTDDRTRQWLEKHHLGGAVWVATVPLEWAGCPEPQESLGLELLLEHGTTGGNRAVIGLVPGF